MTINGTLQFHDIEGGIWRLAGEDGETYDLVGGDLDDHESGTRVAITGTVHDDALGIGMGGGATIEVQRCEQRA